MSLASRSTRAAIRPLRQSRIARQPRRCASDSHGHDHAHGQGESALHLKDANPSGNESLGPGLFLTLAAVPLFYVGYSLAYGSQDNYFARVYQQYKEGRQATIDADELHQSALSEAIRDRARLSSYPRETTGPELKYPEMFNAGSPWNQAAGESSINLKQLEDHYRKVQAEVEAERTERLKGGKVSTVYD